MESNQSKDKRMQKKISVLVIVVSILVVIGQVAESWAGYFLDLPASLRMYFDPLQYFIGLMFICFIFIVTAIDKYETTPNPLLNTIKRYFVVLFLNDFFMLLLKIIQKSNVVTLKNGFTGIGKFYLFLSSARYITDLTMTSVAIFILISGLALYKTIGEECEIPQKLCNIMLFLVVFKWVVSLPVNLTGYITSQAWYTWSLALSQSAQIIIVALLYWVVKENHQKYRTKFFYYFTWYYGITFFLTGLTFTYSMGSYGLLQRFPAGEVQVLGGFGQFVVFASYMASIILNYIIYLAISGYSEVIDVHCDTESSSPDSNQVPATEEP